MGKKKILIVDDDKPLTELLALRLEHSGDYEVKALLDARSIISYLHEYEPDVVLLDLLMPDIGGLEVLRMLNNDAVGIATPVIITSCLDGFADKIKAYKLGIVDYFVKPVDIDGLVASIEKAFKNKPQIAP